MIGGAANHRLAVIKTVHTIVWAFFVACIGAIWLFALRRQFAFALIAIGIVFCEVIVLLTNGLKCPLTPIAARYTANRTANFDIYLPAWLAGNTKQIFGPLYAVGIVATLLLWALS